MTWRWLHRHPLLVDVSVVAVLLVVGVGAAFRSGHPRGLAMSLAVVETLPLLYRRRFPLAVTLVVGAVSITMIAVDVWLIPIQLGVALYTVGATGTDLRRLVAPALVVVAVGVGIIVATLGHFDFGVAAARVVFLAAALLLGESIGSRRAYVREIEDKAARLEREQETERRRVVAEEQARIARELHDVVAHALSVIVVQATAAVDAFQRDPREAEEPIEAVRHAARAALADLRRVLGVLHSTRDYSPQPGLAQIDDLAEGVRATGLAVSVEVVGKPRELPAALDLSAYRIIQEALTNSLKHANAAHVDICIRYGESLQIDVRDDGRGPNGATIGGRGLIGMRERVTLLGGTLSTGTAEGGGYRVSATIPIDGSA
jgi:signal transduction histidine kinase